MEWVRERAPLDATSVLDIGGRDVNGTPRSLFARATTYHVLDIVSGADVDIVADAAEWSGDIAYDLVLACNVFEHAERWPEIVATAFEACHPGGVFVATMGGPGWGVHSGIDGGRALHPGETYANVEPAALHAALMSAGFVDVVVDFRTSAPPDLRCRAVRPKVAA